MPGWPEIPTQGMNMIPGTRGTLSILVSELWWNSDVRVLVCSRCCDVKNGGRQTELWRPIDLFLVSTSIDCRCFDDRDVLQLGKGIHDE
jgi:hypothetical protein